MKLLNKKDYDFFNGQFVHGTQQSLILEDKSWK